MTADRPSRPSPRRAPRAPPNDPTQASELFGPVYDELRRLAASHLRAERASHTLQPTALVHEAFVKLASSRLGTAIQTNREQFFAVAARAMRQVLVDHARKRLASKRDNGRRKVTLHDDVLDPGSSELDALALHDALEQLTQLDGRMAQVVELRFFGGLGIDEIAKVLAVSDRTVDRAWKVARAWLLRELGGGASP